MHAPRLYRPFRLGVFSLGIALCFSVLPCPVRQASANTKESSQSAAYAVRLQNKKGEEGLRPLIKSWQQIFDLRVEQGIESALPHSQRFEQDRKILFRLLEADGYYGAAVDGSFNDASGQAIFLIDAGPRYVFGSIRLLVDPSEDGSAQPKLELPDGAALSARALLPARAEAVLNDETFLERWVEDRHCLFDHRTTHEAAIDHATRKVDVTYRVLPGPEAYIGSVSIEGLRAIASDYAHRVVKIREGDCFKRTGVNAARMEIQSSSLFSRVDLVLPEAPDSKGEVPVTFRVTEGKHRTITAGGSYGTDIGPAVTAGWEHRNLLGRAEKFSSALSLAMSERSLDTRFEKPHFLRDDQRLKLGNKAFHKDTEAYEAAGVEISAGLSRALGNAWQVGFDAIYGFERVRDNQKTRDVALFSLPLFASQDKRDDILHPTRGWAAYVSIAPSFDTMATNAAFLKNRASGSFYYPLIQQENGIETVWASRAGLGSLWGASRTAIPASERLYAGGAGSIRGYGQQMVGPLNANHTPLGGLSSFEVSTELRLRAWEDYGLVLFIDGGQVYSSSLPEVADGLRWSAGLGFRYFTAVGPLRLDFAFPLNGRQNIDRFFQFYLSLGQAF